ncbi:MAG: TPM domain-containing protein [Spirochaetales bacterium]
MYTIQRAVLTRVKADFLRVALKNGFLLLLLFLLLFLIGGGVAIGQITYRPTGFVNDFAGVVDQESAVQMEKIAQAIQQKTGAQVAIVTVPSIEPYPTIDEFSIELAQSWGIGRKGKDDGVLILLAMKERRVKIEVGYGLEGAIPDAVAGRILDEYVIPAFRQQQWGKGLLGGLIGVAARIAQEKGIEPKEFLLPSTAPAARTRKDEGIDIGPFIFILIFLLIGGRRFFWPLLFLSSMRPRRRPFGGGFGSGGFGGGFGGSGGGFGGFGGGSFGGGGASRGF